MWFSDRVPDTTIQLDGLTAFRADRNAALSGKTRGGGLCVYINVEWCKNSVLIYSYCSSLMEFVTVGCRPFYLPWEFTTVFIVGVYIPPSANAKEALCELYGAIRELQNAHPDGLFIIAGDFNQCKSQDSFECTDWDMFKEAETNGDTTDLEECTSSVTSHISKCINDVTIFKSITTHSSQKPWMTAKPSGRQSVQRIHGHFQSSGDTWHMWQGIQSITNHRPAPPACGRDASLPDALNSFYAQFEAQNDVKARKTIPPPEDQVLCLTTADVRKTLCRINPQKAAGPDNIPGRVLKECAEQLADVFTDIYNISLSSAIVPMCLKTTTLIPMPKKSPVSCLNDYCPIALTPIIMKCFERLVMRQIKDLLPPSLDPMHPSFEAQNDVKVRKTIPPPEDQVLCLTTADVRKTLCRVNPRKAAGPDNIPGRVLRECAEQLVDVFTDIYNISLSSAIVPMCLKTTTLIPMLKKSPVSCLNDYCPVALTPIIMKCFERLIRRQIKDLLPPSLDPMQFAYHPNCSMDNAITTTLHLALTHLDNKDSYIRMLFIDFSSAFNTIIPQHLTEKLSLLGINTSLCNWILDFLTGRPQSVQIRNSTSGATTLNTGAPQGCVLSPLLFTLLTHDYAAMHSSNHIINFADDTIVVGLISKNDESAYREEVQRLTAWYKANNLSLNVEKTKEMVVDLRRAQSDHSPLNINGSNVEIAKSTKFLGVHLAEGLTPHQLHHQESPAASLLPTKAEDSHLPPLILTTFYRGTSECILSSCITAWFGNCTVSECKTLQRIMRTAEKIIRVSLPSIMDIYSTRCIHKANSIVDDPTHPSHTLFTLLPYRSIRTHTSRLLNSFFPQAI
ncbi:hypothetical protein QTP70_024569, partial [Hemibagrus guttatus]